jgi:hypothetical protein
MWRRFWEWFSGKRLNEQFKLVDETNVHLQIDDDWSVVITFEQGTVIYSVRTIYFQTIPQLHKIQRIRAIVKWGVCMYLHPELLFLECPMMDHARLFAKFLKYKFQEV